MLENIQHAQSRFTFSEEGYVQASCDLFCGKPTPEEAFYNTQVVCTCEDHRLKIKDHEKKEERSRKAREDVEFKKEALQEDVRLADKGSKYYDELIRDLTESFVAGEFIDRNPESLGSSSKVLIVPVWRLGNWKRGENWLFPSFVDQNKISYKEDKPNKFPDHNKQTNKNEKNLFLQMVGSSKAHVILVCDSEAGSLKPYDSTNILRSLDGLCALMIAFRMLKIFVLCLDLDKTEVSNRLLVQEKITHQHFFRTKEESLLCNL